MNISFFIFFSACVNSFKNSSSDFNECFLCLSIGTGLDSGLGSGSSSNSSSGSSFSSSSRSSSSFGCWILSRYFIGNNSFLKLLRTFPLTERKNAMLFRKNYFFFFFSSLSIYFNSLANLLCSSLTSFNNKYLSCINLKKQKVNNIYQK